MKVKIKEQERKFEPIKLTVTIESEEELCDLWHRHNIAAKIVDSYSCLMLKFSTLDDNSVLWDTIDKLIDTKYPHLKAES